MIIASLLLTNKPYSPLVIKFINRCTKSLLINFRKYKGVKGINAEVNHEVNKMERKAWS